MKNIYKALIVPVIIASLAGCSQPKQSQTTRKNTQTSKIHTSSPQKTIKNDYIDLLPYFTETAIEALSSVRTESVQEGMCGETFLKYNLNDSIDGKEVSVTGTYNKSGVECETDGSPHYGFLEVTIRRGEDIFGFYITPHTDIEITYRNKGYQLYNQYTLKGLERNVHETSREFFTGCSTFAQGACLDFSDDHCNSDEKKIVTDRHPIYYEQGVCLNEKPLEEHEKELVKLSSNIKKFLTQK